LLRVFSWFKQMAEAEAALASTTTIVAELALALHPILIKQIGTTLPTQLLARLGVYSVLAWTLARPIDKALSWGSLPTAAQSIGLGLMNLVHIGCSYLSYQHLPAGSALALFYTYPFFNILAGVLFLGDSFNASLIPLLAAAAIGVFLIARSTKTDTSEQKDLEQGKKSVWIGVVASLVSALTETAIFLVAKSGKEPSAWLPILRLYPGALAGLLAGTATGLVGAFDWRSSVWIPMLLFNIFIGFLGYSLRFWSIPRLPTVIFSVLSFLGVAAGYGWGVLYANEKPSLGALTGAGLITASVGLLRTAV
jgi:drug/metabolite transporter (DMT)-like permease